ncbi:hypothetical protein Lal_00001176 [Lupinus albus]|uniref:Putative transcription factor MADS-type1 family n=1 Tax=Lupinus albus TaxID=3870 RepID=A0A6A4NLM2_LUPAL|nr:putative transcription factor MADS-type1 family [Lupinus albus]KAE9594536.1 putative transcription factor MADS-type1 family [Lupinus albus]KAF1891040.1 hypothetical protein Lal_00001176 [Lupinus albus]
MARKKVNLAYIANDSKRKESYKKRKNSLIKKTNEISTLCGIDACAIIYGQNEPQPEVWPSHLGVQRVLHKFGRMSQMEQSKKMMNQETFLKQSIIKAKEQLKKQKNENRKKEMALFMFNCLSVGTLTNNVNMADLNDLLWIIDQTLKEVEQKKTREIPKEAILMTATGVEALNWEKEPTDGHIQNMTETNVNAMQKHNLLMDSVNGGWNEMFQFGDFNPQNGF